MPDDFGNTTFPVARKEHRCVWCGGPISVGEKHTLWVGRFDGEFQSNRLHDECCVASGQGECGQDDGFIPGGGEMPARVKAIVQARAANA